MRNVRSVKTLADGTAVLSTRAATALVVTSGISAASIAFFARSLTDAGLSAAAVVLFRFAATVLITGRSIALSGPKRAASTWAFVAGFALGLGWVCYVMAIETLQVATVAAIYMTYPAFALVATWAIAGAAPATRGVLGAVLVLAGALIAVGPTGAGVSSWTILLAFAAPLSFGFVVAVLSDRVHALQPIETIAATSLGAFLGLVPIVATQPLDAVIPADGRTWVLAISVGLLTSLIPMVCFVVGAPVVGSARAGAAASLELPMVFVIAWTILGEPPTLAQVAGGTVILLAVMVSPARRSPDDDQQLETRRRRRPRLRPARLQAPPGRRDGRQASLRPGRSGPQSGALLGTTSSRRHRRGRSVRAGRSV